MTTMQNARPAANGTGGEQVGQTGVSVPPRGAELRPVAGWCPPGGCRARLDAELELAVTLAFEQGRAYERNELAALEVADWKALARKTWEQAVAERIAVMERNAARINAELGRPPGYVYRGGPVDWETGRPLCANGVDPGYLERISQLKPCPCVRLPGGGHRTPDSPIGAAA